MSLPRLLVLALCVTSPALAHADEEISSTPESMPSSQPAEAMPESAPAETPQITPAAAVTPAPAAPVTTEKTEEPRMGTISVLQRVAPSAVGIASGVTTGAVVAGVVTVLLALVLGPVAWAWASAGGGFNVGMFAQFGPAAFGAVFVAFVPALLLTAVVADAAGYVIANAFMQQDAFAAGIAALVCAVPALALGGLGLWAVLTLLAIESTIGASSYGHRLPGDPNHFTYQSLAASAAFATVLGVVAWGAAIVARPFLIDRFKR